MGHIGDGGNVGDKQTGIAGGFDPDQFGILINQRIPGIGIARILDESKIHITAFRKYGGRLFVALAENIQGSDHIITRPRNGENKVEQGLGA